MINQSNLVYIFVFLLICEFVLTDVNNFKVLLVGGVGGNGQPLNDVELVSFSSGSEFKPCYVGNLPFVLSEHKGAYINGEILICGGRRNATNPIINDCYQLVLWTGKWYGDVNMNLARNAMGSAQIERGWLLSGGGNASSLKSSEFYSYDYGWQEGPNLPEAFSNHCTVQMNLTHTAFLGGDNSENSFWIYNWSVKKWWKGPDMIHSRQQHQCGISGNGGVIAVGGKGLNSTETWNPKGLNQWSLGPSLPQNVAASEIVYFDGKMTMFGGINTNSQMTLDAVTQYDPDKDEWVTLDQSLKMARYNHATIVLPNDIFMNC